MARRIVVTCDGCPDNAAEEVPARTYTVAVLDLKRTIEWCATQRLQPLADLLAERGVPVEPAKPPPTLGKPRRTTGAHYCPACPEKTFTTQSGLRYHLGAEHRWQDPPSAVFGGRCPLCNQDCAPGTGLAVHAGTTHGLTMSGVFRAAADDGDLHGVVGAVVRKLTA